MTTPTPSDPDLFASRKPRIISKELVDSSETRWLSLQKLRYLDVKGDERTWEIAERRTRPKSSDADSVVIFPILVSSTGPPSTILVTQYRPPVAAYTIELPAGLIDDGETPEQAAIRELKEETGYTVNRVVSVSALLANTPEMTADTMRFVTCLVDLSVPENQAPNLKQSLQDDENIQLFTVPLREAPAFVAKLTERGYQADVFFGLFMTAFEMMPWLEEHGLKID